jgi:hypothetical protein
MKAFQKITLFFLLAIPFTGTAETKAIPFTLDDRDRIIRTEQKVEAIDKRFEAVDQQFKSVDQRFEAVDQRFKAIDQRFDAIDKRFDQLFNFLWAIVGIFTTMMISVFGFAFWDRTLSLSPLKRENARMLNVLRDFAEHQPKLHEILKNAGLL